jgi:acyl carrier protein
VLELEPEIKALIISTMALEDIGPDDIDPQAPLFNEGLGLDSIDALAADSEETRRHFTSVRALSAFVAANRKQ